MSEVQSRPAATRGRGSSSRGRGGFSSRGGRGGRHATNGDKIGDSSHAPSNEDEGEIGQLKKQYGSKVSTIKELFPDWTDEDVVYALQETDGDLETTVERISDGTISQWGEVSKNKKDRSRSKAKDASATSPGDATNQSRVSRGGRAGFDTSRGGRGRGTERGRGGRGRGASVAHLNGTQNKENIVDLTHVVESSSWDIPGDAPSRDTKPTEESSDTTNPAEEGWGATATGAVTSTVTR